MDAGIFSKNFLFRFPTAKKFSLDECLFVPRELSEEYPRLEGDATLGAENVVDDEAFVHVRHFRHETHQVASRGREVTAEQQKQVSFALLC